MWTEDRRQELLKLEELLNEVKMINSGSHCLQRIAKCITLAEQLTKFDYGTCRQDFKTFLFTVALEDMRSANNSQV